MRGRGFHLLACPGDALPLLSRASVVLLSHGGGTRGNEMFLRLFSCSASRRTFDAALRLRIRLANCPGLQLAKMLPHHPSCLVCTPFNHTMGSSATFPLGIASCRGHLPWPVRRKALGPVRCRITVRTNSLLALKKWQVRSTVFPDADTKVSLRSFPLLNIVLPARRPFIQPAIPLFLRLPN